MSKRRNRKVNKPGNPVVKNSQSPKSKPEIKKFVINSGILYLIFVIGYLIFCTIQSLISYGELGHFYVFGRRVRLTEITESPALVICYLALILLICVIPNLIMYVREMREYKSSRED